MNENGGDGDGGSRNHRVNENRGDGDGGSAVVSETGLLGEYHRPAIALWQNCRYARMMIEKRKEKKEEKKEIGKET